VNQRFTFFLWSGLLCGLLLLAPDLHAQWQDTLKEVSISDHKDTSGDVRRLFAAGQQVQKIDAIYKTMYQSQSIATLLSQQTPVFVKSYGINGMATMSFRGASAAQSAVLWNGVPILNPALGVADISLLSTGLFDDISVQYGGSAALYGSGNVGGALLLNSYSPDFYPLKDAAITLGMGSFGRMDGSVKARFQKERWHIGFRGFYQSAENNFNYRDQQQQVRSLDNAVLHAGGALLTLDYNLKKGGWDPNNNEMLSFQLWYQQYQREIPPALFEQLSVKQQKDASLRSLLSWQKRGKRSYWYAKGSLNREQLRYEDGVVLPDNRNTVIQYYQETGWRWRIDNGERNQRPLAQHHLLVFVPLQYAVAKGENIDDREYQFRPAIVAAYNFESGNHKLKANAALRQEWVNGKVAPLLPGAGAEYQVMDVRKNDSRLTLSFLANVQRTYRIPTLNELYYFPGGNRNLKPEQGWNEDAGYNFTFRNGLPDLSAGSTSRLTIKHGLSIFNRDIKDWIYWLGGAIWTPYNIAAVHSRGFESDNRLEYRIKRVQLHLGVKTAYVLSTSTASYLPGDGSIGKQIPYTPRYNAQGNLGFSLGGLFVNYNHTYTGYRFVTVDESQYLKPYQTGNVQLLYTFIKKAYLLRGALQVQNVWNTAYQVVNARPMPGRYLLFSVQIGWKG
jgi:vitamin B12 transporter